MDTGQQSGMVIPPYEAESYIRNLENIPVVDVGGMSWTIQHQRLQKLSLQAHISAKGKHDEYVKQSFADEDRVDVLIHELIVAEAWKEKVLPLILPEVSEVAYVKVYMAIYNEVVLCQLLAVIFYGNEVVDAAGEALMDLADYCCRRITELNVGGRKPDEADEKESDDKGDTGEKAETVAQRILNEQVKFDFQCATSAVTILAYITNNISSVPLGVSTRLLNVHDIVLQIVPLLDRNPWLQREGASVRKFIDNRWQSIEFRDLPRLSPIEGHVWMILYNLLQDSDCRKKYNLNEHRKTTIVALRKHFNEILTDQLPMLKDLHRTIEEMSILAVPGVHEEGGTLLHIEQVPEIHAEVSQTDWAACAAKQLKGAFSGNKEARMKDAQMFAEIFDMMPESVVDDAHGGKSKPDAPEPTVIITQISGDSSKTATDQSVISEAERERAVFANYTTKYKLLPVELPLVKMMGHNVTMFAKQHNPKKLGKGKDNATATLLTVDPETLRSPRTIFGRVSVPGITQDELYDVVCFIEEVLELTKGSLKTHKEVVEVMVQKYKAGKWSAAVG